ncbi:MAG: ABC transporter ATP-binding protein [Candidatus Kariarchaeaceae archaeon]|jgi:ABC-2 type transport system ATP-binding protein
MIEFTNASFWYGEVIALNEVSFEFSPGITGLVGSNGAGKTTSIKLIASLLKPNIGTVTINGEDIWQNYDFMREMGYAPEVDKLYGWMTGRKFLQWSSKLYGLNTQIAKKKTQEILEEIGMTHAADRPIDGYSRGMRQRIKFGQAMLHDPTYLLVDEPMSGTDPIGRNILANLFTRLVKEQGITIIVSSHVLHELEKISDRIIMLEKGKLVAEGTVVGVRKALSKIPHKVKITCSDSGMMAESIASKVLGLQIIDPKCVIVEVKNREQLYYDLNEISMNRHIQIHEFTPLDEDLNTIFNILRTKRFNTKHFT